jgi:hypothetical protein
MRACLLRALVQHFRASVPVVSSLRGAGARVCAGCGVRGILRRVAVYGQLIYFDDAYNNIVART